MAQRRFVDEFTIRALAPRRVITRQQLLACGVHPRAISRRALPGGPWTRLLPGVYVMQTGDVSMLQLMDAALRYAGDQAMVTGMAAARLYGLRRPSRARQVHMLVPQTAQPTSSGFALVERTWRLPDPLRREGLPLAPLERALIDGVRRMSDPDEIQAILAEAVQRGYTTPDRLMAELDSGSTHGTAIPRRQLFAVLDGARSVSEADAQRVAKWSGLPMPSWNAELVGPLGDRIANVDGWFDEVAMAWEIDSYAHHLLPADYGETVRRHNVMVAAGIVVVHTLPTELRRNSGRVIANLQAAYEQARLRPRPPVRMLRAAA